MTSHVHELMKHSKEIRSEFRSIFNSGDCISAGSGRLRKARIACRRGGQRLNPEQLTRVAKILMQDQPHHLCTKASSKHLHHRFVLGNMWWSATFFTNAPCVGCVTGSFEPSGEADISSRMCLCPEELSSLRCWQIIWLQACQRKTALAEWRRPSPVWERLGNTAFLENCWNALCQALAYWLIEK